VIDAVVFDVGGVLCASPVDEFSKVDVEYGLPADTLQGFIRGGSLWGEVERGRKPLTVFFDECVTTIRADHGVEVPPARLELMLHACMGGAVRAGMVSLVNEISAAGHKTGLLTNIFAERREWLHGLCGDGVVDVICDSSEVGMRKPDEEIYVRLLQMLDLPAERVAFVDDFQENLDPASAMGMTTVLYEGEDQVRAALADAGVRTTRPVGAATTEEVDHG
jgi:epoxide hydrolase-like predicted phosphatase